MKNTIYAYMQTQRQRQNITNYITLHILHFTSWNPGWGTICKIEIYIYISKTYIYTYYMCTCMNIKGMKKLYVYIHIYNEM